MKLDTTCQFEQIVNIDLILIKCVLRTRLEDKDKSSKIDSLCHDKRLIKNSYVDSQKFNLRKCRCIWVNFDFWSKVYEITHQAIW